MLTSEKKTKLEDFDTHEAVNIVRKYFYAGELSEAGWPAVSRGKSIVSYCDSCRSQQCHVCTGEKDENGSRLLRFECVGCLDRLNGNGNTNMYTYLHVNTNANANRDGNGGV